MKYFNIRMIHSVEFYGFILCTLLLSSYYTFRRFDDGEKWLKHSHDVLASSIKIQLLVVESELCARNFSLTGESVFLTAFDSTSSAAKAELLNVRRLTSDNPSLIPILDSVNVYLLERISFHRGVIRMRKEEGLNASVNLLKSDRETISSKTFGHYIKQIDRSEQVLIFKRQTLSDKALVIANVSFIATAMFVLVLIVNMMRRNRREAKERDKLLDELVINSERMKQAEKLAAFGVWSMNLETGIINTSDEMWRIWGYESDIRESTLDNYLKKVHPDDYKFVRKKMLGLAEQQGEDDYTFRLMEEDNVKTVSTGTAVIRDANDKLISITGYAQDISEKILSATHLALANKELSLLFNRIGEVLFSRDVRRDNYITISDTCLQVYGYSADEFLDDQDLWLNLIHPDDRKVVTDGNLALARGEKVTNQYRIIKRDGSERWLESSMVAGMDEGAHLIRTDGVTRGITDAKLQALERIKMVDDLIQRNKTLEEFTYIVSHNLRVPIANIIGLGEVFKAFENDAPEKLEIQDEIILCINQLDTMIYDLNAILQVREQQVSEKKEMIYFNDLLKEVIETMPHVKDYENIDIIGDFSAIDSYYSIRNYITNIFFNLVLNSVHYRRDNVKTNIHITSSIGKDYIELVFTDNGKGIDLRKNQSTIFGLYKRFDDSVVGKGMGLFMVKTQVELLGGTISVESELESGTSFKIHLPL